MIMEEKWITSFDGHKIHCCLWDDVQNPKGIVQIFHGMAEYIQRYDDFAKFLNQNGYIVFGDNHRAHGKTAGSIKNIGKYQGGNLLFDTLQDEKFFSKMLKEKYNLPLYIFAHSYGSFIAQNYIENCNLFDRAILSGSACMKSRLDVKIGLALARLTARYKGNNAPARLVEKLSFNRFNKYIKDGSSWINSDPKKTQEYYNDPQCGVTFSAKFYIDLFSSFKITYENENLSNIPKDKPIMLLSGKDDPIGKNGKLVSKLYKLYKEYDIDISMKLYEGARHEILNEKVKEQVYNDILNFFNGKRVDSVSHAIRKHRRNKKEGV